MSIIINISHNKHRVRGHPITLGKIVSLSWDQLLSPILVSEGFEEQHKHIQYKRKSYHNHTQYSPKKLTSYEKK